MTRAALPLAGLAILALAWSPLPAALAPGPFAAHMIRHMGVVAVAAPLLALGVAGSRLDPARRWRWAAFAAVPASLVELVVVWAWHFPALHRLAQQDATAGAVEQGSFLAAGLLVWTVCLGGGRAGGRRDGPGLRQAAAGVLGLLLTSVHMTLLGALLALTPRPLYHAGGQAALDDQALGGVVMLLAGGVAYLAGGLALAARLLSEPRAPGSPAATE